ncbi:MAG: Rsd/AlgQ family anti-sigma factor [Piscirickettsiaceae bacterium]|nr:MAG: Rsd/AlgQ family anti-sigma factor [Piscirickettsiaceae bacterium]PCI70292.1 MAG: Rsd/AlgQ family anti-sigma factor [Piscirickettsiaceae bacterium]
MVSQTAGKYNKREQTNHVINELLDERSQVWSLYCSAAGMEPLRPEKTIEDLVQEFCQLSVDYISLGHFGLYQRILDGNERRKAVVEVAEKIYPQIAKATEAVLNFNDKYQTLTPAMILNQLSGDLSDVGEQLATRIELEDQLIETMTA